MHLPHAHQRQLLLLPTRVKMFNGFITLHNGFITLTCVFGPQHLPAGGPLREGGAGDGWSPHDCHEQAQRNLLHPVQWGDHAPERAGRKSLSQWADLSHADSCFLHFKVMRCSKIASVKVAEITELISKALENDKTAR